MKIKQTILANDLKILIFPYLENNFDNSSQFGKQPLCWELLILIWKFSFEKICRNKAQKENSRNITYLNISSLKSKYTFSSVSSLVLAVWDGAVIKSYIRMCGVTPGSTLICIRVSAVIFFQPCTGVFFRCITVKVLKLCFNASTLVAQKGNVQLAQLAVNFIHSQ